MHLFRSNISLFLLKIISQQETYGIKYNQKGQCDSDPHDYLTISPRCRLQQKSAD